jgi:hypothetical protein
MIRNHLIAIAKLKNHLYITEAKKPALINAGRYVKVNSPI